MPRLFRLFAGLALAFCALHAMADTTVYLVRHGEKVADGSKDPALSPEGQARARNIAAILSRAGIARIYSTPYQRTQQTAQPLAAQLGLPVQSYDPSKQAEFAREVLKDNRTALIVGHSNTLTALVTHLGGAPGADIPETEYERLYQLTVGGDGKVRTVLLSSLPYTPAPAVK
ncbi:MAG TPA: phosphoglycerate mutase family protein [Burkholderiaceae bacterium]